MSLKLLENKLTRKENITRQAPITIKLTCAA